MRKHSVLETSAVFSAYVALSLFLTYPLVLNFSKAIPGTPGDGPVIVWNLWWAKYALLDLKTNPFYTNHIFYPEGLNLAFHAHTFLLGVASIPFQIVFDVITAYNIILISSLGLSGLGAYALTRHLTGSPAAAFVAGIIYAFCPYIFAHMEGHLNLVASQWIPLYILFLIRIKTEPSRRLRNGIFAGLFLLCAGWSEYTYFIFLVMFTGLYVGHELIFDWRTTVNFSVLKGHLALASVFVLGFWPIVLCAIKAIVEGEYQEVTEPVGADIFVADLLGFVTPSVYHSLWGERAWSVARHFTGSPMGSTVFPGYVAILLAIYASARRFAAKDHIRFWTLCLVVFAVLSLGSHLHVLGRDTEIPMPFIVFESLPILRNLRAPGRFAVMFMLCVAVLSAFSLTAFFQKIRTLRGKTLAVALVSSLVLLEYLAVPYPMYQTDAPPIYEEIRRDKEDVSILEIPLGWYTGYWHIGEWDPITYYYQSVHQKRVMGGAVARCPVNKALWISSLPVIRTIIKLQEEEGIPASIITDDRHAAIDLARSLRIRYVIVQQSHAETDAHKYLLQVMPLRKIYEDGRVLVYRVDIS
ncbi:MAG: hypothetical protein Kow0099_36810 [Candidatus Abyssubacteria bacterium]